MANETSTDTQLLALCLQDESFYYRVRGLLTPDFFNQNKFQKFVFSLFQRYLKTVGCYPTRELFTTYSLRFVQGENEKQEYLRQVLGTLYEWEFTDESRDRAVEYYTRVVQGDDVRRHLTTDFIPLLRETLESNDPLVDYQQLQEILAQCMEPLGRGTDEIDVFNLFDLERATATVERLYGPERELRRIPTSIPSLNKSMQGGPLPGETAFVAGTEGSGKTIFVTQWIMSAFRHKKKSLLVNVEMPQDRMFERYLQYALRKPYTTLNAEYQSVLPQFKNFIEQHREMAPYAPDTMKIRRDASMARIYDEMILRERQGISYDMVVIDYVDLLATSVTSHRATHEEAEYNYNRMQELGSIFDCVMVSPAQINDEGAALMRAGKLVEPRHTTVCKKKKDHCDYFIILYQTEEDERRYRTQIRMGKSRYDQKHIAYCTFRPEIGVFEEGR